jgi:hypothetical protein
MPMYQAKAGMGSRCPCRRQRLSLLQDVLHRCVLQVGRITVFTQQALHMPPDIGRVESRCIQSTVTAALMTVTSSCAITPRFFNSMTQRQAVDEADQIGRQV